MLNVNAFVKIIMRTCVTIFIPMSTEELTFHEQVCVAQAFTKITMSNPTE